MGVLTPRRVRQGFRNLARNVGRYDVAYLARLYGDYMLHDVLRNTPLRHTLTPTLQDLFDNGATYTAATDLLSEWMPERAPELDDIISEHARLADQLNRRAAVRSLPYLDVYAVSSQSSLLIYAMVRLFQPRVIVETGVANGASTFFLLNALERNGVGELHSVDIAADVGGLLEPEERDRVHLRILPTHRLAHHFADVLDRLPPLDLFLHDSDHRYVWQSFEYDLAWQHLARDGILATDDADFSFAFIDFCRSVNRAPMFAIDVRKVFGILPAQRPVAASAYASHEAVGVPSAAIRP